MLKLPQAEEPEGGQPGSVMKLAKLAKANPYRSAHPPSHPAPERRGPDRDGGRARAPAPRSRCHLGDGLDRVNDPETAQA
jgi:hypothetical protein